MSQIRLNRLLGGHRKKACYGLWQDVSSRISARSVGCTTAVDQATSVL